MQKLITLSSPIAIRIDNNGQEETKLVSVVEANMQRTSSEQFALHISRYYDSASGTMQELVKSAHVLVRAGNIRSQQEVR